MSELNDAAVVRLIELVDKIKNGKTDIYEFSLEAEIVPGPPNGMWETYVATGFMTATIRYREKEGS